VIWGKHRRRVRVHLIDPPSQGPTFGGTLPSIEGILIHSRPDFEISLPKLIASTEGSPIELDARSVVVPRERVAFFEVLS
jgi:hypothetical protein